MDEKSNPREKDLSEGIRNCDNDALKMPKNKKFHKFFSLKKENFNFSSIKSYNYTIITIMKGFESRTIETKKKINKN